MLLNRTAGNLGDCVLNVKKIAEQAKEIGPGVERINGAVGALVGALPLLSDCAERIGVASPEEAGPAQPPQGLGYLDR